MELVPVADNQNIIHSRSHSHDSFINFYNGFLHFGNKSRSFDDPLTTFCKSYSGNTHGKYSEVKKYPLVPHSNTSSSSNSHSNTQQENDLGNNHTHTHQHQNGNRKRFHANGHQIPPLHHSHHSQDSSKLVVTTTRTTTTTTRTISLEGSSSISTSTSTTTSLSRLLSEERVRVSQKSFEGQIFDSVKVEYNSEMINSDEFYLDAHIISQELLGGSLLSKSNRTVSFGYAQDVCRVNRKTMREDSMEGSSVELSNMAIRSESQEERRQLAKRRKASTAAEEEA